MNNRVDIIIAGGGMAGATMALALAPLDLTIAIIEAHPYQQTESQPSFDDRCLALAYGSKQIYQSMGLWQDLQNRDEPDFAAIKQIHVSDRGRCGATRLDCRQENVSALGYVVESRLIGNLLIKKLRQYKNIQWFCPGRVKSVTASAEQISLMVEENEKETVLEAALLIIADGANSTTRESLGIRVNQKSYGQTAVIANIETEIHHQGIAYERFTETGPLAVLPLTRNRCSVVWTVADQQLEELMALDDLAFIEALQERFGYRLGRITKTGRRASYPLNLMTVDQKTLLHIPRIALIGNAAHGVHPVAGQGFNLGMRDIAALSELIASGCQVQQQGVNPAFDPGSAALLSRYWQWRQADIRQVTTITNSLIGLFSNNSTILSLLRNTGLVLADVIAPLKRSIAREAMGTGLLQGKMAAMTAGRSIVK